MQIRWINVSFYNESNYIEVSPIPEISSERRPQDQQSLQELKTSACSIQCREPDAALSHNQKTRPRIQVCMDLGGVCSVAEINCDIRWRYRIRGTGADPMSDSGKRSLTPKHLTQLIQQSLQVLGLESRVSAARLHGYSKTQYTRPMPPI